MAPPRSVPPAATPQRIPVPGSGPPAAGSGPPAAASIPPRPALGSEPVDLDAEVVEAADDEAEEARREPAVPAEAPPVVFERLTPMRRLSIAEPDAERPSSPAPAAESPLPVAALGATAASGVSHRGVGPVVTAPMGTSPAVNTGAMPATSPPNFVPAPVVLDEAPERLPSFDDPEHHHSSSEDRSGLVPPPMVPSFAPDAEPSSQDPDEVATPVPVAPVHVSAPPPFVPPPSPLLPDFAGTAPLAPPPAPRDLSATRPPSVVPPAPVVSPPEAVSPVPERRPSRPPPVLPEAVVLAIQPGTYQPEASVFEEHDEDGEMRLSETDLEISTTGEPPEVVLAHTEETPPPPAAVPVAAALPAEPRLVEAPVPDIALSTSEVESPNSDAKKPPPPKRTAKPALPSAAVRRRPWWETLFGDDFARAHRSPSPRQLAREVNYMVTSLSLAQNHVVLDLGCGQGEHSVELTRRGVSVVGYDLSVFQLAMAGDRAQQEGQKINFLQGDMREMAFDSMFDAVVCWDTTFGYFEEEKNVDVARRIWAGLKPGGSLLLHVMNRDFAAKESPTNIWFEGDGCVCMDDVDFDWITSRLRVKRSLILDDGRSKELHYSVRLYDLSELGKLLHDVGFRVAHVSGDVSTPGAFFGPVSPYLIIRAQRP